MSTIFGIAPSKEQAVALVASLQLNEVQPADISEIPSTDIAGEVPLEAADAKAIADDFAGDPKARIVGGVIGAAVGVGVLATSLIPGVASIGPAVAAFGATVSGTAGSALGALIGSAMGESKVAHYERRLKEGCRMVVARVADELTEQFVGLFVREGLEDIAVLRDAEPSKV